MNNNFNQEVFKTTDKIRNKHKKNRHMLNLFPSKSLKLLALKAS